MRKIVYQTDQNGKYVGPIELNESDISPLDGVWLIPGGCVEVEPPTVGENQYLVWNGQTWEIHEIPQEPEPASIPPTKDQLLIQLDAQYQYQFNELKLAWVAAQLDGNTALVNELQTEYQALKQEYQTEREAIING